MPIITLLAGFLLTQQGRPTSYEEWKARKDAERASLEKIDQAAKEVNVWYRKAEVDLVKGNPDEAERKVRLGLNLYPEYAKGAITSDAYDLIGRIDMARRAYGKAIKDFRYALAGGYTDGRFSTTGMLDIDAKSNIARCYVKLGQEDLAVSTAVELAKTYQHYFYSTLELDELPSIVDPHSRSVEATIRVLYACMPAGKDLPYHKLEDMKYVHERYPAILGLDLMIADKLREAKEYAEARRYAKLAAKAQGGQKAQLEALKFAIDSDEDKDNRAGTPHH